MQPHLKNHALLYQTAHLNFVEWMWHQIDNLAGWLASSFSMGVVHKSFIIPFNC